MHIALDIPDNIEGLVGPGQDPDRFLKRFAPNSGTLATELGRLFIRIVGMLISGIAGLLLYAIASSAW